MDDQDCIDTYEQLDGIHDQLCTARYEIDDAREQATDDLGFDEEDRDELLRLHDDLVDVCERIRSESNRIDESL